MLYFQAKRRDRKYLINFIKNRDSNPCPNKILKQSKKQTFQSMPKQQSQTKVKH